MRYSTNQLVYIPEMNKYGKILKYFRGDYTVRVDGENINRIYQEEGIRPNFEKKVEDLMSDDSTPSATEPDKK